MPFTYNRTVRFQDTDAAGVVYFANVLAMCHEAFEESLTASGIDIKSFFSNQSTFVTPIVYTSVDFLRPMYCGDRLVIQLIPRQVSIDTFEVTYQIFVVVEKLVAKAITKHVCIDPVNRVRQEFSAEIIRWLREFG